MGRTWPGVADAAGAWWSGQRGNPDIYPPGVYGLAVPAWPRSNSAPGGNKLRPARAKPWPSPRPRFNHPLPLLCARGLETKRERGGGGVEPSAAGRGTVPPGTVLVCRMWRANGAAGGTVSQAAERSCGGAMGRRGGATRRTNQPERAAGFSLQGGEPTGAALERSNRSGSCPVARTTERAGPARFFVRGRRATKGADDGAARREPGFSRRAGLCFRWRELRSDCSAAEAAAPAWGLCPPALGLSTTWRILEWPRVAPR